MQSSGGVCMMAPAYKVESLSVGQCSHSREGLEGAQTLSCCHCSFPRLSQLRRHEDNPFHIPIEKNGPSPNAVGRYRLWQERFCLWKSTPICYNNNRMVTHHWRTRTRGIDFQPIILQAATNSLSSSLPMPINVWP